MYSIDASSQPSPAPRSPGPPDQMYFVGFLFGLGFDTSTEVGLLAITATTTSASGGNGVPPILTLLLPLTFASGMSLLDTLDGMLMTYAYGWAATNPAKKLLFNVFLTGTSSLVEPERDDARQPREQRQRERRRRARRARLPGGHRGARPLLRRRRSGGLHDAAEQRRGAPEWDR